MSREEQWSQKGKKAYVDGKVGECFQWKSHGQCSKGDSCGFSHELASGNRGGGQRRKGQSSSPAPNSKAKTDGEVEKPSKESGNIDESSSDKKEQHSVPIQKLFKKKAVLWFFGILQCVKTTSLRLDAHLATNAIFEMLRPIRSPARSQRMELLY